jgi:DNA mismatch endonuclease, patch repair protein
VPANSAGRMRSHQLPKPRSTHALMLVTTPQRSSLMRRIRQRGTAPELVVREIVSRLGHRVSANAPRVPGTPDIVIVKSKCAVFVHGCYWHRHAGCPATTTPKQNAEFWLRKFEANMTRDRRKVRQLRQLGYRVITVWECQTKHADRVVRLERRLARLLRREP